MDEKTEMAQEPEETAKTDIKNKDRIENCLLRLCAVINGTWNDILASIQSISFLRETALYIDCTILAIWKRRKTGRNKGKY
ncbi:MAG: hypothetical protein PHY05_07495 [Methanothrix sp.]|nr:hypothetical protein [Methanothrix sp.]